MDKSETNKMARLNMGDLWTRARPKKRKGQTWETCLQEPDPIEFKEEYGRLVGMSPTDRRARMNMGD